MLMRPRRPGWSRRPARRRGPLAGGWRSWRLLRVGAVAGVVLGVRVDDAADEPVPDDVVAGQPGEVDVVDVVEDVAYDPQARTGAARQVDLGDVAGDDHLRAEAEPGQEHLHLLRRRVLRLVEDDERVVERAAAHVGQRGDLDRARTP